MRLRNPLSTFRGPVLVCALLTALSAAGYGVMFSLLDDYRDEYGISESALGLVVSVGFLSSFVAQIFIAPLADRGHARSMLVFGNLIQIAGFLAMIVGTTAPTLIMARIVTGIGAGMAMPAQRRLVVLSDSDNVGRNVGLMFAFDVGGFALGPAVGAIVGGFVWPYATVAILLAALLLYVPRIHVVENDVAAVTKRFAFDLFRNRHFAAAVCFGVTLFIMVGTFDALWVLVLDDLGAADWMKSFGIVAFSVPFILFGAIGGKLAERVGPFRLAAYGLSVGVIAMFLYGRLPTPGAMFAIAIVHGLNDGVTASASGIGVGLVVEPERQASAQGMLGGVQTLVGGLAAAGAGVLFEYHGRAWTYSVCALLMAIAIAAGTRLAWPLQPLEPMQPLQSRTTTPPLASSAEAVATHH